MYNLVQLLGFSWIFVNLTVRFFILGKGQYEMSEVAVSAFDTDSHLALPALPHMPTALISQFLVRQADRSGPRAFTPADMLHGNKLQAVSSDVTHTAFS